MIEFFQQWVSVLFSTNPTMRAVQIGFLVLAVIDLFLVFFTLRDIVQRTHSFFYQAVSIFLVAVFPLVGFFLYLLIRPMQTLRERELHAMLMDLFEEIAVTETDTDDDEAR